MPELTPQERLQPALLDRLTDRDPDTRQEPREHRVMSRARLREAVLRDLAWLFNTTRFDPELVVPHARDRPALAARKGQAIERRLSALPHARRSVVNYGLPALSGRSVSAIGVAELERGIRQAILDFEPRILAESLRVTAIVTESSVDHHNVIGVEIHAQLWAQPVPLELLVRTEIDLETGAVDLMDLAPSRKD